MELGKAADDGETDWEERFSVRVVESGESCIGICPGWLRIGTGRNCGAPSCIPRGIII